MNDEKLIKLQQAMNDTTYEDKIKKCNSSEELYVVLEEKEIGFSKEEVVEIYNVICNAVSDELSEESLDNVSGGVGVAVGAAYIVGMYIAGRLYGKAFKNKYGKYCK